MSTCLSLEHGKYVILHAEDGTMQALRYGTVWRDLTGDKLILALVMELERMERMLQDKEKA
jgi:hypothetical protein